MKEEDRVRISPATPKAPRSQGCVQLPFQCYFSLHKEVMALLPLHFHLLIDHGQVLQGREQLSASQISGEERKSGVNLGCDLPSFYSVTHLPLLDFGSLFYLKTWV